MAQNLTTPFLISVHPKRLNWVKVFTAEPGKFRGADPNKKNFQVQWIIEKDDPDLKEMSEIAMGLLQKVADNRKQLLVWKEDGVERRLRPHQDFHWPFLSGEAHIEKARQSASRAGREWKDSYEQQCIGKVVLNTTAQEAYPPILIIPVNGSFVQLDNPAARMAAKDRHFYRGMLALGKVAFQGYDTSATSWGVTAYVNEVVATGTGERIGGAQADVAAYGRPEVVGTVQEFDPTAVQPSW